MANESIQRRAKVGGEIGANGEFYEGGKFIATKNNPKSSPPLPRELSAEEVAQREANQRKWAAHEAWVNSRVEKFADLLACLEFSNDVYKASEFHLSLAQQLRCSGYLSPRQAQFACKAMFGRESKKNRDAWDDLAEALIENFQQ